MARVKKGMKQTKSGAAAVAALRPDRNAFAAGLASLLVIVLLAVLAYSRNSIYLTYVTLWKSVSESSPNKRRAHENYGQALSTAGSLARNPADSNRLYLEAMRQFEMVMALPDDGSVPLRDLYREIGVVHFRMGEYDAAAAAWRTGLQHAPYDPSLLNNLSIVLMQQGKIDEAAQEAKTALYGDPNMPQALNTLGQVFMAKHEYAKAADYFLRALDREPDMPARYWNVALALDQAGRLQEAMQYARKYQMVERDPAGQQRAAGFIQFLTQKMNQK